MDGNAISEMLMVLMEKQFSKESEVGSFVFEALKTWSKKQIQHVKQSRETSVSFSSSVNIRESYWKHSNNRCPMLIIRTL